MNQKGYTLVELLLALPIGAAIMIVVVTSIFQIAQGRVDIAQKSVAMGDIDDAAYWLNRDLLQAQTTDLIHGAEPVSEISMVCNDQTSWAAGEDSVEHFVTYTHSGTQLLRNYDGNDSTIGKYITDVGFSIDDRCLNVTLVSCPGLPDSTVTRTYAIRLRPETE